MVLRTVFDTEIGIDPLGAIGAFVIAPREVDVTGLQFGDLIAQLSSLAYASQSAGVFLDPACVLFKLAYKTAYFHL